MSLLQQNLMTQKQFTQNIRMKPLSYRKEQIQKIKFLLQDHEDSLLEALYKDLKKPLPEALLTEVHPIYREIKLLLKNLNKWSRSRKTRLPLTALQWSRAFITPEPRGQVLILSPWNYPLRLSLLPLLGALAAGNTVTLKLSEGSPHTSLLLQKIISDNFDSQLIYVLNGDRQTTDVLLEHPFDFIFYTGNPQGGKKIMQAAAQFPIPVVLELGGKNPCIIDSSAHLKTAARRIVWGKFMNAGQTCAAPDYLLIQKNIKNDFLHLLADTIEEFYGSNPKNSPHYGKIINDYHFDRLIGYLKNGEILWGGNYQRETHFIAPTLMINPQIPSPLMSEEIFGPILPCLEFNHFPEVLEWIQKLGPNPLALYFFSQNQKALTSIMKQIPFGGGCLNDCLLQLASPHLPLGGVGHSGFGRYQGQESFNTFSHFKTWVRNSTWWDCSLRYPTQQSYFSQFKWLRKFW